METMRSGGWRRRALVAAAGAAGGFLLFGSIAWACTQRVGTMLVCAPPSQTYVSSTQCGKVSGTTQTGKPKVLKAGGTKFSVKASNFYSKKYNVTFRNAGSTQSCHRDTSTTDAVTVLKSTSGATSFMGPNFYAEFNKYPVQSTIGEAKVCAQDMPDVVTGQVINVTVA
jgi:hypothetical protein